MSVAKRRNMVGRAPFYEWSVLSCLAFVVSEAASLLSPLQNLRISEPLALPRSPSIAQLFLPVCSLPSSKCSKARSSSYRRQDIQKPPIIRIRKHIWQKGIILCSSVRSKSSLGTLLLVASTSSKPKPLSPPWQFQSIRPIVLLFALTINLSIYLSIYSFIQQHIPAIHFLSIRFWLSASSFASAPPSRPLDNHLQPYSSEPVQNSYSRSRAVQQAFLPTRIQFFGYFFFFFFF